MNMEPTAAASAKLVCGMIGADDAVMDRAEQELTRLYGEIDVRSATIPFDFTDYYCAEMGEGLLRRFVSFRALIDPGRLAGIKRRTTEMEQALGVGRGGQLRRRVNLDPGYITSAKLVLATTKDVAHRVYLGQGIYAEVTLSFAAEAVRCFPWTYPDFRSGRHDAFLLEARRRLAAQGLPRDATRCRALPSSE